MKHISYSVILCVFICNAKDPLSKDIANRIEDDLQKDVVQIIENDIRALDTLSSIKDDITQNMRLAYISDSDYIDFADKTSYEDFGDTGKGVLSKPFQGEGRASDDDNNRLVSHLYFWHLIIE